MTDVRPITLSTTPAAIRQRRFRLRHKLGDMVVPVELPEAVRDGLVSRGHLSAADLEDKQALATEIAALLAELAAGRK